MDHLFSFGFSFFLDNFSVYMVHNNILHSVLRVYRVFSPRHDLGRTKHYNVNGKVAEQSKVAIFSHSIFVESKASLECYDPKYYCHNSFTFEVGMYTNLVMQVNVAHAFVKHQSHW